jgi:DMSO/TMAO reductase YedYZ heme-binding membrane subunit
MRARPADLASEVLTGALLVAVGLTWAMAARGLTPGPLAWTLTRVSGVAAYAMLSVAVAFGAALKSRLVPVWLARPLQYGWHGVLSGFALALTAVHVAFVTVDTQQPQGLVAVLVPGRASYAPFGLALGTLAAYAALAVYVSFAARARLSRRAWVGLHLLAYPAFALATAHGLIAGTDHLAGLYLAGTALAAAGIALRWAEPRDAGRGRRLEA